MTTAIDILRDGFGRIADELPTTLDGLTTEELLWQPAEGANHIAWLAWHIGRCEDAQIAPIGGVPEVYRDGWVERFGLPYEPSAIGYGQSAEQMQAFRLKDPSVLTGYYAAVHAATEQILDGLSDEDLNRAVDEAYQTTCAVRLVSIMIDVSQHLGQIGYLRGLVQKEN
ncbi:DinB family protein [Brooklawnia sp.]|uniref:mycothiol transferase n=1 Tax=Brooklawnia sp. TaxID=2699740 RepID=UPI00311F90AD